MSLDQADHDSVPQGVVKQGAGEEQPTKLIVPSIGTTLFQSKLSMVTLLLIEVRLG